MIFQDPDYPCQWVTPITHADYPLAEFRKIGVKVVAADSGTDLTVADDDATRTLIRQVLGAVAQFEKSLIVSKLRAARVRKRRETGRCEGRKPFGTRLSYDGIADRLNELGTPTRTGARWRSATVRGILRRAAGDSFSRHCSR